MRIQVAWQEDRARAAFVATVLGLLAILLFLLMDGMRIPTGADIDTINFGLSALRFDVLQHQPHPPGYPGYVLWLKLIHWLVPSLGPIAIAEWGSRLCALLCLPASAWACRQLLDDPRNMVRPLLAASLAAFHPMLIKYGSDGQSHAADALCTFLLFGSTQVVVRNPKLTRRLLLVAGFGLAGAIRPNIPVLLSPLMIWAFWHQPWKEWFLAILVGIFAILAWMVPLVELVGGYDLYRRSAEALLTDFFGARYSVFGSRATCYSVAANMFVAEVSSLVAAIPFIAWARGQETWRRVVAITVALNVGFYAFFYCAETGYVIAIAALACLTPASWPVPLGGWLSVRIALAFAAGPLFLFVAPANVVLPGLKSVGLPTLSHAAEWESFQVGFRRLVCQAAGGRPSLVLSDFKDINHHRGVSLQCPNVMFASVLQSPKINPNLDNIVIAQARGIVALPTGIPLEVGPPVEYDIPQPIERVLISPDATTQFIDQIASQSSCQLLAGEDFARHPGRVFVWPARCLTRIKVGRNILRLTPTP
jgi:hypothetical protein